MADEKEDKGLLETFKEVVTDTAITGIKIAVGINNPSLGGKMLMSNLGVNEGIRDFVRDIPWAITWLLKDGAGGRLFWGSDSGDQQWSPGVAHGIEEFWDKYVKQANGLGQSEFRMATGWYLPENMKYNGKLHPKDEHGEPLKEINDITAIFYKDAKGQTEVMTMQDPRWKGIVGEYMATQLATIVATGAAGTVLKGAPAARAFSLGGKAISANETAGSMGYLADSFAQPLFFKPAAINAVAEMFQNPATVDENKIQKALNTLFSQYSNTKGPMTEQYYVQSLPLYNKSPIERLEEVSQSRILGYRRDVPFEVVDIAARTHELKEIPNTNLRDGLSANKEFNLNFYRLVERSLKGGLDMNASQDIRLSDPEVLSLRFMLNITSGSAMDLHIGHFSQADRMQTLEELRNRIPELQKADPNSSQGISGDQAVAEDMADYFNSQASNNTQGMLDFVQQKKAQVQKSIDDSKPDPNTQTLSSISRFGYLHQ